MDLEHEPFPSLPAVDSPFFSRELFARAMEPRVLRQVVSELCERELLEKGTLSHTPIEERVETGLSDDEYLIALAIHLSPQEFATDFESDYLAHDIVPDSQAIPAGCVSPVIPFRFTFPDEVIREKAEFKCLERELEKLRESLIAEHLKKHPNDDRTQAELQTRRDYYQTEREKMQAFLDTEQLPPISKQAMFIWMDWVYALDGKITPRMLKKARHYLRELVEIEVSRIEATINKNPSIQRVADLDSNPSVDFPNCPEQENAILCSSEPNASFDPITATSNEEATANDSKELLNGRTKTPPSIDASITPQLAMAERAMKDRKTSLANRLRGKQKDLFTRLLESDDYRLTHEELAREVFGKREDDLEVKTVRNAAARVNRFFRDLMPLHIRVEKGRHGNLCIAILEISEKS
ncbi:hypothetical protein [Rhodopirellula baltica]|uniref:hypothetical protein n=1 Tax=Rhodopirellula baltica TaxID=265606 RepID=UPI00030D435C|nr:hypothetical protein [Rhodopirellula baltica]